MSDREEFVANLREAADFFENHPDCPVPDTFGGLSLTVKVNTIEDLRKAFHLSGKWDKEYQGDLALYRKIFGNLPSGKDRWTRGPHVVLTLSLPREEVCVKTVVGKKYIEPPAYYSTPQGYYEDVVEWTCV